MLKKFLKIGILLKFWNLIEILKEKFTINVHKKSKHFKKLFKRNNNNTLLTLNKN